MIWVNVDKPTKKCTIHIEPECWYVANKGETSLKGVGKLKKDGGWLSFCTLSDAEKYCKTEHPNYSVKSARCLSRR